MRISRIASNTKSSSGPDLFCSVRAAAGASVPLRRLLFLVLGPRVRAVPALAELRLVDDNNPDAHVE